MRPNLNPIAITSFLNPGRLVDAFYMLLRAAGLAIDANKNFADVVIKHYKVAVGSSGITFFNGAASTDAKNFPDTSAKRNKGEPVYITRIRCVSGASATLKATDWIGGVQSAELQNGTFSLTIGSIQLKDIPMTVFNSDGTETSELGFWELSKPIMLADQQDFSLTTSFDVALATANQNLGFELHGVGQIS